MTRWQRSARLVIAVFGVVFAVFVARELKRREPPPAMKPVVHGDPGAVIETTGGNTIHLNPSREDVDITYKRQYTFEDGSSKLEGVTIVFDSHKLEEVFAQSDFITIHLLKTKDSTNLIGDDLLAKAKPGLRIVNAARGGIIDEDALAKAIIDGRTKGGAYKDWDDFVARKVIPANAQKAIKDLVTFS